VNESRHDGHPVGVVVVGTGWGCLTHVPALHETGYAIKALVGTDLARTQLRAHASNIPYATTDFQEALALPGVEAVVIATPPGTHADLVLTAIARGMHVMCEKPFATDVADAIKMHQAAQDAGVVHAVGHEMRWLPHQAAMAMALRDKTIGTPTFATYLKLNGILAAPTASVPDWFGRREEFGGWMNAEVQHVIDEIRTSLGEFATVDAAEVAATRHDWDAAESFIVQFELASGAVGVIQSSIGTFGPPISVVRVSGTEGTIWTTPDNEVFRAVGTTQTESVDSPPHLAEGEQLSAPSEVYGESTLSRALAGATRFSKPTQHLLTVFRQRILGVEQVSWPPLPTFADGLANTAVHATVRNSISEGKKLDVPGIAGV
jgi:predicted dehydrogenase